MPTYRYRCDTCKLEEEIVQRISDPALCSCPHCHKDTYKRIPPKEVAIQFKGSGFYITDYKDNKDCGKGSCGCH